MGDDRLQPRGTVDVGHGRNLRLAAVADRRDQQHEPRGQVPLRFGEIEEVGRRARSSTDGANGRYGSRNLIFVLTMSFMSARRGSARMLRLPSARGPHSKRPCAQPTTLP